MNVENNFVKKKTGFLLGAGASYEMGLPLVDEFTIEFKRALLKTFDMRYYKPPHEIYSVVKPLLLNGRLYYEDIIGRIEVEINRCSGSGNLYQDWHALLGRYLEAIFILFSERHIKNRVFIDERLELLEEIVKYCDDGPLWIFSLNHDLLVEILANRFNIPVKYGFHSEKKIGENTFELLTKENMENNQFLYFNNEPGINLVKLHGSLDIFVEGDKKNYIKLVNKTSDHMKIIDDVDNLLKSDATTKEGVKCTNEITYYDESNILQFLQMTIMSGRHKYSSKVSHNMDDWFYKVYSGCINNVANIYCIGYGFQDIHVNNVLYDWLSFSSERRMIIVNPSIKNIPGIFKHIENQVEIVNLGFLEFLNCGSKNLIRKIKINKILRDISRFRLLQS